MNDLLKILLTICGIFIVIIGGLYLLLHIAFDGILTGTSYNKQDLINNYEQKKSEIIDVKKYIDSKIDSNTFIHIEFENEGIGIFHVNRNGVCESNWDLNINSNKTDSLLTIIGWTINDLEILRNKLTKANCVSVYNGQPITIGWQRSGMGMYFYKVFDQNLSDSLINRFNDGCTYIYHKDNVVLEYGGGAIGPQCFPGYERKN